jgi:hypothetical protein
MQCRTQFRAPLLGPQHLTLQRLIHLTSPLKCALSIPDRLGPFARYAKRVSLRSSAAYSRRSARDDKASLMLAHSRSLYTRKKRGITDMDAYETDACERRKTRCQQHIENGFFTPYAKFVP